MTWVSLTLSRPCRPILPPFSVNEHVLRLEFIPGVGHFCRVRRHPRQRRGDRNGPQVHQGTGPRWRCSPGQVGGLQTTIAQSSTSLSLPLSLPRAGWLSSGADRPHEATRSGVSGGCYCYRLVHCTGVFFFLFHALFSRPLACPLALSLALSAWRIHPHSHSLSPSLERVLQCLAWSCRMIPCAFVCACMSPTSFLTFTLSFPSCRPLLPCVIFSFFHLILSCSQAVPLLAARRRHPGPSVPFRAGTRRRLPPERGRGGGGARRGEWPCCFCGRGG